MSANDTNLREVVAQQAAEWFIANRASLNAREREDFAAWLQTSPVHVEEYLSFAAMAPELREVCGSWASSIELPAGDPETLSSVPARRLATLSSRFFRRARPAMVTLAVCTLLGAGMLAVWKTELAPRAPESVTTLQFTTARGKLKTCELPDGSVLHLNTDSAATVRYSRSERVVILNSGEAEIDTVHDGRRPFRVFAGAAQAVDVGTRFDVRLEHGATVVTVLSGKVAVGQIPMTSDGTDRGEPAAFVTLTANQQIRVAQGAWPAAVSAVDAERTASWLRRQISFNHEPLARVATEFNRYTSKPIEIDTPGLGNMEISGVFATDDIDAFVAFLRSLDGVHVEVTPSKIRVTRD
jgi:transmembrane sensor